MRKLVIFLFVFLPFVSLAQRFKGYRYELVFAGGMSNFLGELGGASQFGTHMFRDIDIRATRFDLTTGLRYKFNDYYALRANLTYAAMRGDDRWTTESFRHYRNLNFWSPIWEFSVNFEASYMKEMRGRRYRMKGVKGRRGYELFPYIYAGLGVFHYEPRGYWDTTNVDNGYKAPSGKQWIRLRKLHTEGQTNRKGSIPGVLSRKQYSGFSICIPVGFGFKYILDRRWIMALDYGVRYTFTDYIDDVSTTYIDPAILARQFSGSAAAQNAINMSDRTNKKYITITGPGAQRGDPRFNDAYLFVNLTFSYKLKTTTSNLPKF